MSSSFISRGGLFTSTNRFLVAAIVATSLAGLALNARAEIATPATASSPVQVLATPEAPAPTIQLADEIIRRLRRLGLNFNRGRIQRPYDPEGELC